MTTITEHPNAELVRRDYEAFNTADVATLAEIFDESASWHTPVFDLHAWDEFWS